MAWWLWALGLATAVSRTTNPLLLVLVLAVLGFVISQRRTEAPWARAFRYYLIIALIIIVLRVLFRMIFATGVSPTDHILFSLPHIPTPGWYAGIQLGGPVSLEALLSAAADGLRLGALLCCIGAANSLANPKRALRVLPGALYELGVAVVVAISVAPQLIESVQRVRKARQLRGGSGRGFRILHTIVVPVLEDALERSLRLAAAMDSRGYGRVGRATTTTRRITAALMLTGMMGLCAGAYVLLDASLPGYVGVAPFAIGVSACVAGIALGGRRVQRTSYRPDPWAGEEWIVAGCGVAAAAIMFGFSSYDAAELNPTFYPLSWPTLPLVPLLGIAIAAVPAFAAPPPPLTTAQRAQAREASA
jgi:energy-coupling factor transport system permease protein